MLDNLRKFIIKYLIYLALIPVAMGAIGFYTLLTSPYIGIEFKQDNDRWYISSIDKDGPAAKYPKIVGKEVLKIGEWQPTGSDLLKSGLDDSRDYGELNHFIGAQKYLSQYLQSDIVTITVRNGEDTRLIPLSPGRNIPLHALGQYILIFLFVVFYALMGLAVILKKRNNLVARLYFILLLFWSTNSMIYGIYTSRDITIDFWLLKTLLVSNYITVLSCSVVFFHFLLVFPAGRKWWFIPLFYTIPVIFTIGFWTQTIPHDAHHVLTIYILMGLGVLIYNYYNTRSSIERTQIRFVVLSLIITTSVLLFSYLLPYWFTGRPLIDMSTIFIMVLIPISMGFSILKYRLMDIDTLFDNTLIYIITLFLLVLIDGVIITFLINIKILNISTPIAIAAGVWVIIFAYLPVRNFIQKYIKRILKREIYDVNTISLQLSTELLSASAIAHAFDKATGIINNALHPKGKHVLFNQQGSIRIEDIQIDAEQLKDIKIPLHLYQIMNVSALPENYAGGICVPVIGSNALIGYIILLEKHSGRLYDINDIKLLNIISKQLAIAIEALQYKEKAEEQDRVIMARELEFSREKDKVSREIHDNAGNIFVQAMVLSDKVKEGLADTHIVYMDKLQKVLSAGLNEIRDLLWVMGSEQDELGELVIQLRKKLKMICENTGLSYTFQKNIENDNLVLSPLIKLNMIRIMQEAATNTLKYAKADTIEASVIQNGDNIEMTIQDNGIGFDPSNLPSQGYGLNNIRKRCAEMGAKLVIDSKPGSDTRIQINLTIGEELSGSPN